MRATIAGVLVSLLLSFSPALAGGSPPDSYVLRDADITYMLGKGMPASELKVLQSRHGQHFLWARRSGSSYVIHDPSVLNQALTVLQRNVPFGPERDARMAQVVDRAIKDGTAKRLR